MENEVSTAAEVAADNPYGLEALINHGDAVSYTVLGILLILSVVSWYIIFSKFWDQYRLGKSARTVERNFWTAATVREGAERLPKDDDFRLIAEGAARAAAHYEGRLGDRISLYDWLSMAVQRSIDGLNSRLSNGLSFLAATASTAPFVGLFGTVYGVLKALISIGLSGQPSIDKVAGPVGEALIMTALGLAVAVPAAFGYNVLLKRNKALQDVMREFSADLSANLIGGLRPEVAVAAKPAAAKPATAGAK